MSPAAIEARLCREARREAGLCTMCGREAPGPDGPVGLACRAVLVERYRRVAGRRRAGLCDLCGCAEGPRCQACAERAAKRRRGRA